MMTIPIKYYPNKCTEEYDYLVAYNPEYLITIPNDPVIRYYITKSQIVCHFYRVGTGGKSWLYDKIRYLGVVGIIHEKK
jgi:hypothetical protein